MTTRRDLDGLLHTLRVAVLALPLLVASTSAQDFRMETDVFVGKQKEPVAQYLTLFYGDVAYDFLLKSGSDALAANAVGEATMFDIPGGRIVLMDPARKVKTEIKMEKLLEFMYVLRERGTRSDSKLPAELFLPELKTTHNEDENILTLASERVTYRATIQKAKTPTAAEQYRKFADWSARLNGLRPGNNVPPFARLVLNQELSTRELIPEKIERTIVFPRGLTGKKSEARSQHLVTWTLSGTDRKRIDNAGKYLADFRPVSLPEYLQIERVASRE